MVRLFLLVLPLLGACNVSTSEGTNHNREIVQLKGRTPKQSIDCCLDSILQQVDTSLTITGVPIKVTISGNKLRIDDREKNMFDNKEIKAWLEELAIIDSIKSFKLTYSKEYYVFSSPVKQATGLAVNFTTWLVFDVSSDLAFEFESLSASHQAFYLEKATDKLHFVSFTFGESFFHQKDFENIVYRIKSYTIDKGVIRLVGEKESQCSCD